MVNKYCTMVPGSNLFLNTGLPQTFIQSVWNSNATFVERCGRCRLQSVKIVNEGVIWNSPSNVYWKHHVERSESVKIILHGNAEFEANDVVLKVLLLINSTNFPLSLFFVLFPDFLVLSG